MLGCAFALQFEESSVDMSLFQQVLQRLWVLEIGLKLVTENNQVLNTSNDCMLVCS